MSNEIVGDRANRTSSNIIPWCEHEHSPVSEERTAAIGGASLLKCGGDISKCQVDLELRSALD